MRHSIAEKQLLERTTKDSGMELRHVLLLPLIDISVKGCLRQGDVLLLVVDGGVRGEVVVERLPANIGD